MEMKSTGRAVDICVCKDCFYYRDLGSAHIYACHYAIETKGIRGIKPSECYKQEGTPYLPKAKGKKKKTTEWSINY